MKGKFLNTKNVVIGLVSLVLIGASATGVTIFLKNRGQAEAAGEQVQNLPTTGREEQDNNQTNTNPGTVEDPNNQGNNTEIPGAPVEPTTPNTNPGTTTPNQTTGGTTTNTGGNNTTTGIEETVRMERQKVFEDLQLSWTTIGIPAITANMGIFKPELQIEKTVTAVVKAGESEQIQVTENNKPMVRAGDTVIYTIQVSNLGNYKATNVVVTDSLDVIFDGKTVPANQELAKIETLEAGKVATLKVGYVVKQEDIDAVLETEQNETISKDIINIATATDGKTTVEDNDEMPVNPDVTINVNKNWQDNDNQDGKRPEKITVELYRNNENEPVETVTIDASSDWKYVFNKLPKYDENKNEITYRVVEVTVPEYDTKYEISDNGVEIYNHHTPETTSISGRKTWNDSSNQDGVRPDSITVELLKTVDGTTTSMGDNYKRTLTGNTVDTVDYSWSDLPVYEAGKRITYTVKEVGETNGKIAGKNSKEYKVEYDSNGMNITNSYEPEKTEVSGRKTWNDNNNQDGIRPDSIEIQLYKTVNETKTTMGDNYKVTLTSGDDKVWQDAELTHTWEDLPKYENGSEITYTVAEITEVNGYNTTYSEDTLTITNSHTPATIEETTVTKVWDDADNQDGIRPDSIEIQLYKTVNGTKTTMGDNYKVTLTSGDDKVWQDTELTYTWSKLPKYENGSEITYTVAEITEVNGYNTTYSEDTLTITNSHTPATIEKTTVTKVWDDADNQDGIRPDSIEIQLYKTVNGTKTTMGDNYKVTLTSGDDKVWQDAELTHTWENLPQYENGSKITYTVAEITEVNEYKTTYSKDTLTITNSHTPATIEKTTVTKVWDDADNQDGIRPDSIEIQLYKTVNGTKTTMGDNYKVTLTSGNDKVWQDAELTHTWEDLPQYENGSEITYTVAEITKVNGYKTTYSKDTLTITNSHTPATIKETTVTKVWIDEGKNRPNSIEIQLYKTVNGTKTAMGDSYKITLTSGDDKVWQDAELTHTWEDLPQYENGSEITYTVAEATVTGYDTSYSTDTFTITNTIEQETISLSGNKIWLDPVGTKHDTITLQVYQNNEPYKVNGVNYSIELADGATSFSFTGLPKYKVDSEGNYILANGKVQLNEYKVVETTGQTGYSVSYSTVTTDNDGNYTQNVTNSLEQTQISFTANKVWVDEGIVDNRKDITVELYKNNVATGKTLQIKKGEKTCTFDGLDRYTIVEENGEIKSITENIYSVQEKTTISGYDEPTYSEVAKDGAEWSQKITNTKTQEKISVEGTKTWIAPAGTEFPKVTIKLLRDGVEYKTTKVTANNTYSFTDLDKFDMENNYREYEYTVEEVVPAGYVATYDGYNITNTKHITATKSAVTSTGVDEVNIGETINYTITITNNTEVATEVTVQDNIPGLNQGNVKVEVNGDITLEGKPLTEVEVQALYNGTFKVNMPATATRTIVIPIKVTAGMTGDKIKNTAYVNAEPTNEVINPIERTVAVTRYKNNLSSTNIILVLDVSSSMKGEKIKTAKQAVIDFIEKTYKTEENKDVTFTLITFAKREYTEGARGDQQGKKYKYHGGLFEFNDSGENKGKYEYGCGNSIITLQNHEDFKTAFEGLLTDRGTNMRAGLEVAYNTIYGEAENTLSKLYPNYDKIVIFFGDGEPYGEEELKNNPAGIKEAAGWLKAKKAKVYSIGFGNGASKGTKGYERLKDISSDGKVYTSSNYTQLVKNFSDIVSADPVVYPYTIDGNAIVELTAESTQKIVVDEKNPIIIKIGDAPEIKITDAATAEACKITYTDKKIIWDVKEYSKDTNLRISYHVQ